MQSYGGKQVGICVCSVCDVPPASSPTETVLSDPEFSLVAALLLSALDQDRPWRIV